ncbi:MAG: NADH-quinone oxidoreductase subunit A [Caldilinea sp.]|nr:NADH-quinone oxidoreductase subunit A [Caldilinea sp.]MDW8439514.1 NADH-quinone oxidoreductase subunit A [Caldilineaceae bacterium]
MAQDYLPLLIFVVIATIFASIAVGLPSVLGPKRKNEQKLEPYESGIIPFHDARRPFPVKYYLVAMLFILFDIEVIFLFPWAGTLIPLRDSYGLLVALAPIGFFLLILILGLVYEWSKGALDWE